jgi:hypothetical protein
MLSSVFLAVLVLAGVIGACSGQDARQTSTDSVSRQAIQFSEGQPQPGRGRRVEGKEGSAAFGRATGNMSTDAAPPAAPGVVGTAEALSATGRPPELPQFVETLAPNMVIRTGHASVEVTSLDTAVARVRAIATALGGYIANTTLQSGEHEVRSATLEIKIPAARFDQAVTGLSAIGKVESVNVSAQDVGEEFVDITARVSNARRLEERLITLLASRTGKLQEVLSVERELARVREEIERYEGRLRYLKSRAAVSTLAVMVHEPNPLLGPPPGQNVIVEALKQAWRHFVGLLAGLIESLGILIPVALILAGLWAVVRRWRPQVITRDAPVRIIEKETRIEEEAPRT